jgi:DUF4097 and DUF4098 domain-containing protein YvlB
MKSIRYSVLFLVGVIVFGTGSLFAYDRTQTFEFEGIQSIDVKTVCGGLEIVPGDNSQFVVVLENRLDHPEQLEPQVEVSRGRLSIEEDFSGRSVRGGTQWTVYVPESADLRSVEFSTASGGFALEGVDVNHVETDIASGGVSIRSVKAKELDLSTASGAIEIEDSKVDMVDAQSASGGVSAENVMSEELHLSTASGTVTIRLCHADYLKASSASGRVEVSSVSGAEMDLSNASGRIRAKDCDIEESVEMSCASGDVRAQLARLPSDFLRASAVNGDVMLEVTDFGEDFTMTLTKRTDRGRIKCPFDYTDKETIRLNRWDDHLTNRYLVQRGRGGPDIELSTATGTIRIDTDTRGR